MSQVDVVSKTKSRVARGACRSVPYCSVIPSPNYLHACFCMDIFVYCYFITERENIFYVTSKALCFCLSGESKIRKTKNCNTSILNGILEVGCNVTTLRESSQIKNV